MNSFHLCGSICRFLTATSRKCQGLSTEMIPKEAVDLYNVRKIDEGRQDSLWNDSYLKGVM